MPPLAPVIDSGDSRLSRPLRSALLLSGAYVALGSTYILVSDRLAGQFAETQAELARIELIKGWLFVFSTGVGLLVLSWVLLHRIKIREQAVAKQRRAILEFERQTIASVFAASVARDINNILVVLNSIIGELRKTGALERLQHHDPAMLDKVYEDLRVLTRRMTTGRDRMPGEAGPIDLVETIDRTIELARSHASVKHCQVEFTSRTHARLQINALHFRHALLNLLINAGDATEGRGRVEVRTYWAGPNIVLEVHDDGPGVPLEQRDQIFESFFTTKSQGTGLGLAMVYALTERQEGRLSVSSTPGRGTLFRLSFPLTDEEPVSREEPPPPAEAGPGHGRVLVVEDEPAVRRAAQRILERSGYQVQVAEDGVRGLEVLQRDTDGIDLVVTDMVMPGMGGVELWRAAGRGRPGTPLFLFTSGYAEHDLTEELGEATGSRFLRKPWDGGELLAVVHQSLQEARG